MLMRYLWGMGIGHVYSWHNATSTGSVTNFDRNGLQLSTGGEHEISLRTVSPGDQSTDSVAPSLELQLGARHPSGGEDEAASTLDDLETEVLSSGELSDEDGLNDDNFSESDSCEESDDEVYLEMFDTY